MMAKKIVITGGSGLLALNWAVLCRDDYNVTLCTHRRQVDLKGVESLSCQLDQVADIVGFLARVNPDLVVHTAGLTDVEECESKPELAYHVNVSIAENVAIACAEIGVRLVHISSDHLFDGSQSYLTENTPCAPINEYGKTKAEAEEKIAQRNSAALIVRTNFFGWGMSYRHSFSDFIVDALRNKRPVGLFDDVFYTPVLAGALIHCVHSLVDTDATGIFNVVGNERLSKYQFGIDLAQHFGFDDSFIKRVQLASQAQLVRRPMDMSLSNRKVCEYLGRSIASNHEQLTALSRQQSNGLATELGQI